MTKIWWRRLGLKKLRLHKKLMGMPFVYLWLNQSLNGDDIKERGKLYFLLHNFHKKYVHFFEKCLVEKTRFGIFVNSYLLSVLARVYDILFPSDRFIFPQHSKTVIFPLSTNNTAISTSPFPRPIHTISTDLQVKSPPPPILPPRPGGREGGTCLWKIWGQMETYLGVS